MINLPHKEPIKFVKNIIERENNILVAHCCFPYIPTLGMVCEAAAQSTVGFDSNLDEIKTGFLVSLKDIEYKKDFKQKEYLIEIEKSFNFGNMQEYKFIVKDEFDIYADGFVTIALQK